VRSRLAMTACDPGTASIQSPVSAKCLTAYLDIPQSAFVSCYRCLPSESERYPRRRARPTVKLHNRRALFGNDYAPFSTSPALFSRGTRPSSAPVRASPRSGVTGRWSPISFLTAASSGPAEDVIVMIREDETKCQLLMLALRRPLNYRRPQQAPEQQLT